MRILLICEGDAETRDSWSGSSNSVLDGLRRRGHVVTACDVDLYGPARWLAALKSFSPRRARWAAKYHFGSAGFEARSRNAAACIATRRGDIDLILQLGATFEPRGRGQIPYVLFCDSNIRLAERNRSSNFGEAVHLRREEIREIDARETRVYADATRICTINQYLADSFVADYGVAASRVHTIFAGPNIDLARLPKVVPDRSKALPVVLFVGREFGRKGGNELVAAFAAVRAKVPQSELWILGPTDVNVNTEGVRCLGFFSKDTPAGLARIQQLYSEATVFCLPTRFDCFPISLLEAMGYGLPCVGTAVAGVPEIIADGATGYVVDVDDLDALASRLIQLLTNRAEAERMGQAGRERLYEYFTWDATVDRMIPVLQSSLPAARGVSESTTALA